MPYDQTPPNNPASYNQPVNPWMTDFSGQLGRILAPYQQMAQGISSPYATMRPNSWLAQNHPQVAGVLDNAFLTGAMTPGPQGPEGVGGGISRAMQGLLGGQQYRRQQQIQTAMLPYQMAQGQLSAMDIASQIGERQAMLPFRMAQERRYDAQSDMYYNRMAQGDRDKALTNTLRVDDKGQQWQGIFDPVGGRMRMQNPSTGKFLDELPAGEQPSFTNEEKNRRMSTTGGLMGEIIDMRMSSDPAIRARGEQMSSMYTGMAGSMAGARTGASQGAEAAGPVFKQTEADRQAKAKEEDWNKYQTNEEKDKYVGIDKEFDMTGDKQKQQAAIFDRFMDLQQGKDPSKRARFAQYLNSVPAKPPNVPPNTWFNPDERKWQLLSQ